MPISSKPSRALPTHASLSTACPHAGLTCRCTLTPCRNYSSFASAASALSWGELSPWNMAIDAKDQPLTLGSYSALLPSYPNLYIAWTNRRFSEDSLLARGEYTYPCVCTPPYRMRMSDVLH